MTTAYLLERLREIAREDERRRFRELLTNPCSCSHNPRACLQHNRTGEE